MRFNVFVEGMPKGRAGDVAVEEILRAMLSDFVRLGEEGWGQVTQIPGVR